MNCPQMRVLAVLVAVALAGCQDRTAEEDVGAPSTASVANEAKTTLWEAMKSEDYKEAEELLTKIMERDPDDFDAVSGRAAVRVFLGDKEGARQDFDAAVAVNPEKAAEMRYLIADRAMWRARGFDMEERYGEALKIYDVLLTLFPESGMAYHDRGGLKTSMKDYAGAIEDLTKAIEFDEGNNSAGDSYVLRARAKRAAGDVAGADEDDAKAEAIYQSFGK